MAAVYLKDDCLTYVLIVSGSILTLAWWGMLVAIAEILLGTLGAIAMAFSIVSIASFSLALCKAAAIGDDYQF